MKIIKYKKSIFLVLGIFFVIFPIAPISRQPLIFEKPDFLVCLIFSWLILDHKNVSITILISCNTVFFSQAIRNVNKVISSIL